MIDMDVSWIEIDDNETDLSFSHMNVNLVFDSDRLPQ